MLPPCGDVSVRGDDLSIHDVYYYSVIDCRANPVRRHKKRPTTATSRYATDDDAAAAAGGWWYKI